MLNLAFKTISETAAGVLCVVMNLRFVGQINEVVVVLVSLATFVYLCLQIYKIYLQLKGTFDKRKVFKK